MNDMTLEEYTKKINGIKWFSFVPLVLALIIIIVFVFFRVRIFHITGHSMNPTLYENDIVLSAFAKEYKRNDLIAFSKNGSFMIKRVIGIGGDNINIDENGIVYINGNKVDEYYTVGETKIDTNQNHIYDVPENSYFVLGDNRENSMDSRSPKIGFIKKEEVIGKLIYSIKPFQKVK